MLTLYLARHGQNEDNANGILNGHRDLPLTAKGLEQAQELADHIKALELPIDKIYASPLKRAFVTAETIATTVSLPTPEAFPLLIERDFGVMTGLPQTSVIERCSPEVLVTETINYFLSPEGAETFPQLVERGHRAIEAIKAQHSDGHILLVTHGDIGKMIYAAFYNHPWKDVLTMFHFGNCELLELSESSLVDQAHRVTITQFNS